MATQRADRLRITEIFHSIQGEALAAGLPCIFVRLTGCNLRCTWCDSEYTFAGGGWMTFDEIFDRIARFPDCPLVEITGGEPLLQPAVNALMADLIARGYQVMIETGGSLDISVVPREVVKIVDLKAPGSGEVERNLWSNLDHLAPHDEIKIVVRDRVDYEWARTVIAEHDLVERVACVHLSPVFGVLHPRELTEWMLADALRVRLNLQIHKFVWDPDTKGV